MRELAFAMVLAAFSAGAGDYPCNSGLLTRSGGGSWGYRPRGGFCEGTYDVHAGSRPERKIDLVSLTRWFAGNDPAKSSHLLLRWSAPSPVSLVAQSLRENLHYQMDTVAAASAEFRWPTTVLRGLQLERADLGVLAWTDDPGRARSSHRLYIPLTVTQSDRQVRDTDQGGVSIEAVIIPSVELTALEYTRTRRPMRGGTVPGRPIRTRLEQSAYAAGAPVSLDIPARHDGSTWDITALGTAAVGGVISKHFSIYDPVISK